MKGQNRRLQQGVMKSPSPDIAHRSIIVNTKSPVNEIKQYIRMRQSSTSPKSMTTSFHHIAKSFSSDNDQINRLKKYIQELQQKINYLSKIHISHDQLTLLNQDLHHQVAQLRTQLRQQKQRNHHNTNHNVSPHHTKPVSPKHSTKGVSLVRNSVLNANPQIQNIPQPSQNDTILRQFNERTMKMSEQIKRLTQKLNQMKNEKDFLEKQNSLLKLKGASQNFAQFSSSKQTEMLKRKFAEEVNRISIRFEEQNEGKIEKLKARLNEVEAQLNRVTQRQNQRKGYTRSNTPNQLKANLSMDTNFRSQNQDEGPSSLPGNRYNMIQSKYTTSPSQFKSFTLEASPIRFLEQQKDKVKRQNEYLKRKTDQLQKQLKNTLIANNDLQKKLKHLHAQHLADTNHNKNLTDSNASLYQTLQLQNQSLEAQLNNKNTEIYHCQTKIHELELNLNKMKDLNNAISNDYEKNLEQQKNKNYKITTQNLQYQTHINFLQQNYLPKQQYLLLQRQIHSLKDSYNRYQTDFERYLKMLYEIRSSITGEGINECLFEVQRKWEGYDELELQIKTIFECYEGLMRNLKKKMLEKDQKIAQLEKDNQILYQSNEQTKNQLKKLQMAIKQYRQPVKGSIGEQQLRQRMAVHPSGGKSRERCQIREYISRTVSKITSLQSEIQKAVRSEYSQFNMGSSGDYSRRPVGPDSVYQSEDKYTKLQFNHDHEESYPQDVQDEDIHLPRK